MNREELQAAIRRPAENAKVSFEPGLVATLLDDVENKPGSLPLLQFALREMWGRQENRKITRKSYDDIGGVEGALTRTPRPPTPTPVSIVKGGARRPGSVSSAMP